MIRRFAIGIGIVLAVLIGLPMMPPLWRELVWRLPTGWISFLNRTLPDVSLNWAGLSMVALCSAIILVCLHLICRWLYRTAREGRSSVHGPERWPLRWTGVLFAAFWLLFALAMGAAGLGRQVTWVFQSRQPLYIARNYGGWADLKQAEGTLATALVESQTNVAQAYAWFRRGEYESLSTRPTLWEKHHVLLFTNAHGESVGYVLIPRDPRVRERIGFLVSAEYVPRQQSMTNLTAVIAHLEKLSGK